MAFHDAARLRVGCSAVALLAAPAAWAGCVPNPTQANATTTCTGSETAGLFVATTGTSVVVATGAAVAAPAGGTAVSLVPTPAAGTFYSNAALTVDGLVDGGGDLGLLLAPGYAGGAAVYTAATVTVGSGGRITGQTALLAASRSQSPGSSLFVQLDNSGTILGADGYYSVLGGTPTQVSLAITNRAGGLIGTINAFASLTNAGTIDGGAFSAFATPTSTQFYYGDTPVTNSGIIRSQSAAATVLLQPQYSYPSVDNTGTIVNTGTGAAVVSTGTLIVTNAAGATIASAGATAIATGDTISLTNRGTITGSVVAGSGQYGSTVDTSGGGTIAGNLTLGTGSNTVIADFGTAAAPIGGITGTIDAGGGSNTLLLVVGRDATLVSPLPVPASFASLGFSVATGATLTLAAGFTTPGTLQLGNDNYGTGNGAVISNATLVTAGPAVQIQYYGSPSFTNNGSITATLANAYDTAVHAGALGVVNNGTITAVGGRGLDLSVSYNSANSGTITATDAAVTSFSSGFTNSGTIRSTGGIGLVASGSVGETITNSGTISGAVAGAETSVVVVNTGTVSGPTGVLVDYYGGLDNRAGGVVDGGVAAGMFGTTYQARITNAGTINGDVNLGNAPSYYGSQNRVIAAAGGIINGNLVLGSGDDLFVTSLTNTGPGAYAGVTGTVTGGTAGYGETIRYLVPTTASAVLGGGGGFGRIGYELSPGAVLTLTAPAPLSLPVEFAGTGTVDLTADLVQIGGIVLDLQAIPATGLTYSSPPNALAVTSRGTLTDLHVVPYSYAPGAVVVGSGSTFTNAGTIVVRDTVDGSLVAIAGNGAVVNSGTISLDGATAIGSRYVGPASVTNSGTIAQVAGGATSTGIVGATTIVNSGTISTGGAAILFTYGAGTVTNSGTIRSTGGVAITGDPYTFATVVNAAGGTIAGVGSAISVPNGATVDNAGAISGDVLLGCASCYTYRPSVFVARPGSSVTGNVVFAGGDDTFVQLDTTPDVSGTIDGGGGTNTFARIYAASATVDASALPTNFQRAGIGAAGAATVVTVTGPAGGLAAAPFFFGDGQIVNTASVNAAVAAGPYGYTAPNTVTLGGPATIAGLGSTLAFTNTAMLAEGVTGTARSFTNSGTISSGGATATAVALLVSGDRFDFVNSGTIAAQPVCTYYDYCQPAQAVTLTNAGSTATVGGATLGAATFANGGTLHGAVAVTLSATSFSFDNSGSISAGAGAPYATAATIAIGGRNAVEADVVTVTNRGTIDGGVAVGAAAATFAFTNSGAIGGAVTASGGTRPVVDPATGTVTPADQASASFTNSGTIAGGAALYSSATATTASNSGSITSAGGAAGEAWYVAALTRAGATATVTNSGTVTAAVPGMVALAATGYASTGGALPGASPVGGGARATVAVVNTGTLRADGGAAIIPGDGTPDNPDLVVPAIGLSATALSDGPSSVTVTNAAGGLISANGAATSIAFGSPDTPSERFTTGASVALFAAATRVAITNAGTITGGPGTSIPATATVFLDRTTVTLPDAYLAGAIQTVGSVDTLVNTASGVITGSVDLGAGDDRVENYGRIAGNVFLRDGNDTFVESLGGTLTGTVDGGAGTNTLILDATAGGALDQALLDRFVNFAPPVLTGNGTITAAGALTLPTLVFTGSALTLAAGQTLSTTGPVTITTGDADVAITNLGTIGGGIAFGRGRDSLTNAGAVGGAITFGGGDDTLTIAHGARFGGAVDGGGGRNTLVLATGGTDATPDELDLSRFARFATTRQDGGVAALSGSFTTGTLTVAAGRLIGRAGSTIIAPLVAVAAGATFGSAGTVVGTVAVGGILSPGASPATMTVDGNVALGGGATALFEITPAVGDQLLVSGTVTVGHGATLMLTGTRPLTPGAPLDLIVAGGGIIGSFVVDQAATVLGFLHQSATRLQLFGEFATDPGFSPQVARTIGYVNTVLTTGGPSPALLAAFPALLTGNASNPAAFALLNPEAYASASRIGTENGLMLAQALRTAGDAGPGRDGAFTFVQGVGGSRRLAGDAASGVSRADVNGGGVIGGLGVAHGALTVAAFGGYLDSRQSIGPLGSHTAADGAVGGVTATLGRGALSATATLAYDGSMARTTRTVPGGATRGDYALHGFIADATVGFAAPLGVVVLRPEIGATHVATMRAAAAETGSAAFALDVARTTDTADFVDGALRLSPAAPAAFVPWLAAGIRHQLAGRDRFATAAFPGAATAFTVPGVGVAATVASASAGFAWRLRAPVSLYGSYRGEFAGGETGHTVSLGARFAF